MRKPLSASRVALLAIGVLCLFGSAAYGQDRDRRDDGRRDEDRRDDVRKDEHPNGIVQDWSHRHVVYPRFGPVHNLIAIQHDERALSSWQDSWRREWRHGRNPWHFRRPEPTTHIDWSIPLGAGTTAQDMFPAKFTFDKNAVPNCTTDFVVFAVNATASGTQPNLVGLNNLYSGTLGGTGICNRTVTLGVDDGVSATTLFSYAVKAAGGQVSTSPALSLDGTKVAFVESAPATTAHFHVLAWQSGAGVPTNLQAPATAPFSVTAFVGIAPVAGTSNATDLVLGATSDTLSSPFIEYNSDMAYVGSDNGILYRIVNVFCTGVSTPCTPGVSSSPGLDASWGSGGGLATGCSGRLTGAVVDGGTGNIFVGCSDGNLYGFTPAGVALSNSPVAVGDGSATGGIVDTPLIDVTNEYVYAVSGNSGGGTPTQVVVQASTVDLSGKRVATLNAGGLFNLHAPAFNNAYLSGTGTPLLYEVGAGSGKITLFGITFGASDVMTQLTPPNATDFTIGAFEISPLTEFFDGGTEDRLFESTIGAGASLAQFNINTFPGAGQNFASEGTGTTGIIVDNAATTTNQADSIYFGALGSNTAVKLTQSGLQ